MKKMDFNSLMDEVRDRLGLLESILPRRLDAEAVSLQAKIPFKALCYRESLIWRMVELSRTAYESFEEDRTVSATVVTRAAVETSAALWYLCGKIDKAVEAGVLANIDDYLMRLLMGNRMDPSFPQAISVLTFVDYVEKEVKGFRRQYDLLSEFAHPNWAGTSLIYSKPDQSKFGTDFGTSIRGLKGTKNGGVGNLSVALMMFGRSYNRISDLMPAFVRLCESQLKETEPK